MTTTAAETMMEYLLRQIAPGGAWENDNLQHIHTLRELMPAIEKEIREDERRLIVRLIEQERSR